MYCGGKGRIQDVSPNVPQKSLRKPGNITLFIMTPTRGRTLGEHETTPKDIIYMAMRVVFLYSMSVLSVKFSLRSISQKFPYCLLECLRDVLNLQNMKLVYPHIAMKF